MNRLETDNYEGIQKALILQTELIELKKDHSWVERMNVSEKSIFSKAWENRFQTLPKVKRGVIVGRFRRFAQRKYLKRIF